MSKIKKQSIIILAIVFVAFSVIASALPFTKNGVFWIAYLFAVLALAAQIPAFKISFEKGRNAKSKFYGFPIERIAFIYAVVQLILSLITMGCATFAPVWVVLVIFTLMLAVAAVGFIAADAMRDEVERQDGKLKKSVNTMRALQSKANALAGQSAVPELKALSEQFRYSDPVSGEALEDAENELAALLDDLQQAVADGDDAGVKTLCGKTAAALTERNRLCKLNK